MNPDALRDWQTQEEHFFAGGFTWTHLMMIAGILLVTWLIAGNDWRRR